MSCRQEQHVTKQDNDTSITIEKPLIKKLRIWKNCHFTLIRYRIWKMHIFWDKDKKLISYRKALNQIGWNINGYCEIGGKWKANQTKVIKDKRS